MNQISPQEPLPLVYLLSDPTDTATYYVRAVLRDSGTNTVIATINLTNQGNRRFSAVTQAPNDASGLGRYIDITVSVYTNSNYTTKSDNYQEEMTKYLVQTRWSLAFGGGGGGGSDIDYKKIREINLDILKSLLEQIPPSTPQPVNVEVKLTPILEKLKKLADDLTDLKNKDITIPNYDNALSLINRGLDQLFKNKPKEVHIVDPAIVSNLKFLTGMSDTNLKAIQSTLQDLKILLSKEAYKKVNESEPVRDRLAVLTGQFRKPIKSKFL